MSFIKTALIAFTAATVIALVAAAKLDDLAGKGGHVVEPNCLGCLCEASTLCNATAGCHTPYAGAYFCGPFLISWAYWADAGKPVINNDNPDRKGAFENCVNDLYCAAETVRAYMFKMGFDCNHDGVVSCTDFVLIHKFGAEACHQRLQDTFGYRYEQCANTLFLK